MRRVLCAMDEKTRISRRVERLVEAELDRYTTLPLPKYLVRLSIFAEALEREAADIRRIVEVSK